LQYAVRSRTAYFLVLHATIGYKPVQLTQHYVHDTVQFAEQSAVLSTATYA
jgi:hypothetical protein